MNKVAIYILLRTVKALLTQATHILEQLDETVALFNKNNLKRSSYQFRF